MDMDRRLTALRDRRRGISMLRKSFNTLDRAEAAIRESLSERYETRASGKATRYALGAMQEVDPDYTQKSYSEGERIAAQLKDRLPSTLKFSHKFQGSVPLNVHIKGVSDVDLLCLRNDMITIDLLGPKANTYSAWDGEPSPNTILTLRSHCKNALSSAYPAVDIDDSGAKSICLTGGSLARKIDIVPSHWHDSAAYQAHGTEPDRGITIFDKKSGVSIRNFPFLHIYEINQKDHQTLGGAKKVIRLLKNIKNDADDSSNITLSSYEIASIVWHFDNAHLLARSWEELRLVASTKQQLNYIVNNKDVAMKLRAPDGTRAIIENDSKFYSLVLLSLEVDRLCEGIASELNPLLSLQSSMIPRILTEARVP